MSSIGLKSTLLKRNVSIYLFFRRGRLEARVPSPERKALTSDDRSARLTQPRAAPRDF